MKNQNKTGLTSRREAGQQSVRQVVRKTRRMAALAACAALLAWPAGPGWSQGAVREASKAGAAAPPMVQPGGANEVLGEIVDPANGNRWVLENGDRPGGPGRLVLASRASAHADRAAEGVICRAGFAAPSTIPLANPAAVTSPPVIRAPVIRAGDRIVLVARTSVMDASLAAVALGPARAGSVFKVRLDIDGRVGGKVLEATALGPGRAEWDVAVGGAWR